MYELTVKTHSIRSSELLVVNCVLLVVRTTVTVRVCVTPIILRAGESALFRIGLVHGVVHESGVGGC